MNITHVDYIYTDDIFSKSNEITPVHVFVRKLQKSLALWRDTIDYPLFLIRFDFIETKENATIPFSDFFYGNIVFTMIL